MPEPAYFQYGAHDPAAAGEALLAAAGLKVPPPPASSLNIATSTSNASPLTDTDVSVAAMESAVRLGQAELGALAPPGAHGDMTRGATADLRELVGNLERIHDLAVKKESRVVADKAWAELSEARWTLKMVEGSLSGATDAAVLLARQPTARQLARPGRRAVVMARAVRAMDESKYAYPDPAAVLGSIGILLGVEREGDVMELEHRILHSLAEGNLTRNGVAASGFLVRLLRAGKIAALKAPDPDGRVQLMRATLETFLAKARAAA